VHENEKIKVVVSQPQSEENRAMEEWYQCYIPFNVAQVTSWFFTHQ
jgi:hypothetical protein